MMKAQIKMAVSGQYVQSERQASGIYMKYAKQLIEQGDAYYCFCDKERLESCEDFCIRGWNTDCEL